ncbi:hypothetical protein F4781DRAFT_255857 [Annulohypoxylon bovei var. microspora]|nr:hypothetical protein F4781DRAFT_255857 [Annulohypoxylon bovei var. microspora]
MVGPSYSTISSTRARPRSSSGFLTFTAAAITSVCSNNYFRMPAFASNFSDAISSITTANITLLGRMLGSHPVVAFVDLVTSHLNNLAEGGALEAELGADFEMFWAVCRYLQMLKDPSFPTPYFIHLLNGLGWALGILGVMKSGLTDRPQRLSDYVDSNSFTRQHLDSFTLAVALSPGLIPSSTKCSINSAVMS